MNRAAVGFRVHSGWAAVVALTVTKGEPAILARERIHLVKTFTYQFRQPYHTAQKMPGEEAASFILGAQKEARSLASLAIRKLQADLGAMGRELSRCGLLLASGRPLPALDKILASHSLIHTADGELFRSALLNASTDCELENVTIRERELFDSASRALRVNPAQLTHRLAKLGRTLGPPWSQDEKFASLAAWLALQSKRP